MKDKEKFQLARKTLESSSAFSNSLMEALPVTKAVSWLQDHNTIFVIAPNPEVCLEASVSNGGSSPYLVRFVAFGDKAAKALDSIVSTNELLNYQENLFVKNVIYTSTCYTVLPVFNYNQFIDLVEYVCQNLVDNQIIVKRFEVYFDFNLGGKLKYLSLPQEKNFYSFLEGYEGEADLYDSSFIRYVGDLMSENMTITEKNNDYARPPGQE